MYFYMHIYIYTHFELNKVIKIVKIKHKRKSQKKATTNAHQPSMLHVTFLTATYFSTSCHLRKVKIIFLYYDSHKKWSLFISFLVYFLFSSQLCCFFFFYICLNFRFSLWEFILLFYFPKFQSALYLKETKYIFQSERYLSCLGSLIARQIAYNKNKSKWRKWMLMKS